MKIQITTIITAILLTTNIVGQNQSIAIKKEPSPQTIGEQITKNELKKHILILASDSLGGREVGKPGELMAANYIANHFKNIGIPPYKNTTYYQEIPLY